MPAFSYTSGNPNNLVANQNASMADIQGPFTDLRTFLNGGTMDETNVPSLAAAFTTWKNTGFMASATATAQGAATFVVPGGSTPNGASISLPATNGTSLYTFVLDPADWLANSRTTKLRIRWSVITNGTAPGITFTPGLYPATSGAGGAGALPNLALGTVVSGSTAAFVSPSLGLTNTSLSSEFNAPSAGLYAFGVVLSGNMAASSQIALLGNLQYRQV